MPVWTAKVRRPPAHELRDTRETGRPHDGGGRLLATETSKQAIQVSNGEGNDSPLEHGPCEVNLERLDACAAVCAPVRLGRPCTTRQVPRHGASTCRQRSVIPPKATRSYDTRVLRTGLWDNVTRSLSVGGTRLCWRSRTPAWCAYLRRGRTCPGEP
ncbi:hypothetical protein K466DRAFT_375077 [Polyporus arcularius HHB13444]|uniref:Uncharacterized protein n=1 Tax=Polyporus arcularius HHB13444 TaxID=1314778 RepID=A0A5C3NT83_9APHY|nr:hypothetical protein K466DRAFT_375077 [Polyporus arcularius HHB13444]